MSRHSHCVLLYCSDSRQVLSYTDQATFVLDSVLGFVLAFELFFFFQETELAAGELPSVKKKNKIKR